MGTPTASQCESRSIGTPIRPNADTRSLNIFPTPEGTAARRLETVLLAMNDPQHRQQRRLMQPAFHRKQIEGYVDCQVRPTLAPRRGLPMIVTSPDAPHTRPMV